MTARMFSRLYRPISTQFQSRTLMICTKKQHYTRTKLQPELILETGIRKLSEPVPVPETIQQDELYRAIDIYLKGHDDAVLESYATFAKMAAEELGITLENILKPKMITDRITVLKSVHIHKKHRMQYEAKTFKRVIKLKHITGCTSDVFLSYLQMNIPAGVAMHVHKWSLEELPDVIKKEMSKRNSELTEDDKNYNANVKSKKPFSRKTTHKDYEEYQTTQPYLIGTVI